MHARRPDYFSCGFLLCNCLRYIWKDKTVLIYVIQSFKHIYLKKYLFFSVLWLPIICPAVSHCCSNISSWVAPVSCPQDMLVAASCAFRMMVTLLIMYWFVVSITFFIFYPSAPVGANLFQPVLVTRHHCLVWILCMKTFLGSCFSDTLQCHPSSGTLLSGACFDRRKVGDRQHYSQFPSTSGSFVGCGSWYQRMANHFECLQS